MLVAKAGAQTSALSISDSLVAIGNNSGAINYLEKVEPKSKTMYRKLAKDQQAKGVLAAALRNYEIILQKDPERVLTMIDYGKLLQKTGQLQKADSIFSAENPEINQKCFFATHGSYLKPSASSRNHSPARCFRSGSEGLFSEKNNLGIRLN